MISQKNNQSGFSLLETLIGLGIFIIIGMSLYFSFVNVLSTVSNSASHLAVLSVIQNEFEGIRNMDYEDIGILGGSPAGRLLAIKTVNVGDTPYAIKTVIRNIDDPFDGKLGGSPNDLAPADYKLIEIEASCSACATAPIKMTSTVSPTNLESATRNGALFINVFDASGRAISDANIHISNTIVTPNITIDDTTGINGILQLVDIATSSFGYNISISKAGYTSDSTLQPGLPANPNPTKPFATVAKQQVTTISFTIDHYSALNVSTVDNLCQPVGNIGFQQTGARLIGTNPNVLEYSATLATDANGQYSKNNLKWDNYNFINLNANYAVSGAFNPNPLTVNPGNTYNFKWLMEPKMPLAALIFVNDQTGQPVNNAKVTLAKTGFSQTVYTGQSRLLFSDWSGGNYSAKSSRMETNDPAGSLVLMKVDGKYATNSYEWLTSETIDFGTDDVSFFNLAWAPAFQPPVAGADSARIQIAANNDNLTWNYVGPDGTSGSYHTISDTQINSIHNNNRYLRYKVNLATSDKNVTPKLDDVIIKFRSSCLPDGQAYFNGLTSGGYSITIEKPGFQTFIAPSFSVTQNWQKYQATITP